MFCSNCGEKLLEGDKFCNSCGTSVIAGQPTASHDTTIPQDTDVIHDYHIPQNPEDILLSKSDSIPGKQIIKQIGPIDARCSKFVLSEEKSAKKNLQQKAQEFGANAIVELRIEKISGVKYAFGTAVIVR